MPAELLDQTQDVLDDLPPYLRQEAAVQTVIDTVKRELERISADIEDVLAGIVPSTATDAFNLLRLWERLLGLPEASPGSSVEERRNKVLTAIRLRNSFSGADWVSLISQGLGTVNWTHEEGPGDYVLTITLPEGVDALVVMQLLRKFTPAHLDWGGALVIEGMGFIIGDGTSDPDASIIGTDTL